MRVEDGGTYMMYLVPYFNGLNKTYVLNKQNINDLA